MSCTEAEDEGSVKDENNLERSKVKTGSRLSNSIKSC